MGDRRMAEIKTRAGSLFLYTHWEGSELPKRAQEAVDLARPRLWRGLGDELYWVRIVVDQIMKPYRDQETGGGIMLKPTAEDSYNHDKPSVIIDAKTGDVRVIDVTT